MRVHVTLVVDVVWLNNDKQKLYIYVAHREAKVYAKTKV